MHFRPLHDRVLVRRIEAEEKTAGGIRMTTIEDVETALRRCHRQLEFLGKLGEVAERLSAM